MILLATNALGVTRAERDDAGDWTVRRLLPGLRVTCLHADPFEPATVWAGTQTGGVLRSDDRGVHWRSAGMTGQIVKSLAVSAHAPGTIYAGTKPAALFRTVDGGASWHELKAFRQQRRWFWFSPADPPGFRPYLLGLALSPSDPGVIVAGIEAGAVLRSDDGGVSWSGHLRGADRDCHDLRFHERDGDWVYEAGGGGPAVSSDGGRNWRHPLRGLRGRIYCMACAADPERPEVWYVSAAPLMALSKPLRMPIGHYGGHAHAGIYRSSGGAVWERLEGGLPQPLDHMPYALLTDPGNPGHLYAGLQSGEVWHSADHGESWRRLELELGTIHHRMLRLDGPEALE